MKNFNVKIIIITLFILVGFSLCLILSHPTSSGSIENTAELRKFLAGHNITLTDSVVFPDKTEIHEAKAYNLLTDKAAVAENLLGKAADTEVDSVYTLNNESVAFSGTRFSYKPNIPPLSSVLSNINISNAGKITENIAEGFKFDLSGSIISSSEADGTYTSVITKSLEGLPIFNDTITLTMSNEGLISIEGLWFSAASNGKKTAKSVADALMQFVNYPERPSGNITITSIAPGYMLIDPGSEETGLKAVWCITLSDGKVFYMDA